MKWIGSDDPTLINDERFAPAGVPFLSFALFMGIAMSITAFPVLARIVQERGLSRTRIGGVARALE